MLDEEQCRRFIIVFGPPCPCETDHPEMTSEQALAAVIQSDLDTLTDEEINGVGLAAVAANSVIRRFKLVDIEGRDKPEDWVGKE